MESHTNRANDSIRIGARTEQRLYCSGEKTKQERDGTAAGPWAASNPELGAAGRQLPVWFLTKQSMRHVVPAYRMPLYSSIWMAGNDPWEHDPSHPRAATNNRNYCMYHDVSVVICVFITGEEAVSPSRSTHLTITMVSKKLLAVRALPSQNRIDD